MIIVKKMMNQNPKYVEEAREGLEKAVANLDKRYKNGEIERDRFLEKLNVFAKRRKKLDAEVKKLNRR